MGKAHSNRDLACQVVALAWALRAGPRPTGPEDPVLDELAALVERGLKCRSFPDDLAREMRSVGLHLDPQAQTAALAGKPLH
jgi:hypothetical protein